MKAIVIYHPGGPEELTITNYPIPDPTGNQVLVKIKAFGLNRSELMTRKGYSPGVQFPRVPGIECVGEVVNDPGGKLSPGQQVAACMGGMGRDYDGGYAEYAALPTEILYPFTSSLPWEVTGALPEMFQTVYASLHTALEVKPGDTLLIRGATSSVGLLAIQMAKTLGLTIFGTTRSAAKIDFLKDRGCDKVLVDDGNLRDQITRIIPEGCDKILELVGTNTLKDSLACAKPGGTVCFTGMLSETWSIKDFAPMDYIPPAVKLTTCDSGTLRSSPEAFAAFLLDIETGKIKPDIGRVFMFDQIQEAHRLMESNQAHGKIVIIT